MTTNRMTTAAINGNQSVKYYRKIHEVTTKDGMNLIMTQKLPVDSKPRGFVMLVHGLGQNRYTWTLTERSIENFLIDKGFSTFNIELRGHGLSRANGSDHPETFETYLNYDIPAFIEAIYNITGGEKIFYMGHSLGGSISYCIGSKFRDKLAGIISIGGPFNMAHGNRLLQSIAHIGVTLGKLYPFPKLQPDVFYIDYIGILVSMGLVDLMDHRWNRIPLQIWYPGSIEKNILKERITKGFDRTSFNVIKFFFKWGAKGKFISSDGRFDFEDHIRQLRIPILFVNGDRDYGVPESAIKEAFEKAESDDKIFKTFGMENSGHHWGHCDLICGKHAPEVTWPYMLNWLEERI
ncbi:MAG: alpha/beta hydrolase [Desulfobacteraceae bacterium]|nr:alpha/beta fold hydrolase [Desulfobacteraceae bacterium]MBC2754456.1 alpha/beta hydrolase [Desulfobacteraceae bacterium]